MTPGQELDGWSIVFLGYSSEIWVGWYQNNIRVGNWMSLKGDDFAILESGWYEDNGRKGDMKSDSRYKKFTRKDIFLDFDYE